MNDRTVDRRSDEQKRLGVPRYARRHYVTALPGLTRRQRKARARINGLAEKKGATVRWTR